MASCSSEIVLHGCRALPIELPGHGFKTVFPPGYATPQDLDQLATARSPLADLTLDDYAEHTLGIVRRAAARPGRSRRAQPGRQRPADPLSSATPVSPAHPGPTPNR